MILFDIKCGNDHRFDVWFRDNAGYEQQVAGGEILCPYCGDARVEKAPMAPHLAKHGRGEDRALEQQAEEARAAAAILHGLREMRQDVELNASYVGERFPEEARKIHYGETERRNIYGEASDEEARSLVEEGVEFSSIPWLPKTQ